MVRTVAETPIFQRYAAEVWSEAEREQFINFIAANPEAGDLIRGSGGCRKVRWATTGTGKSGGARVIYSMQTKQRSGFSSFTRRPSLTTFLRRFSSS